MSEMMANDEIVLPKGFDCIKSFNNYSSALAIEMWVNSQFSVKSRAANFEYPRGQEKLLQKIENGETQFLRFFTSDDKTKFARMGAQVVEEDGTARFTHKSIQEYFAADVLFTYIYDYDPKSVRHVPIEKSYLNASLLYGTNKKLDYNSPVLDFIVGNILSKREKFHQKVMDSYDKSGQNISEITDEELISPVERNIINILSGIDSDNVKTNYM